VPFGLGRDKPWPERENLSRPPRSDDAGDDPGDRPPRGRGPRRDDDDGGAGVREPRRPKPTLPGAAEMAEPELDRYLDLNDGDESVPAGSP
jgi:hypothetical protein